MKANIFLLAMLCVAIASCNKDDDGDKGGVTAAKSFENVIFNTTDSYFSTDGSMTAPVDETEAQPIVNKIDLTFIYNHDYYEPGFFDPIARSQDWGSWADYRKAWLSAGVETRYYSTTLTKAQFDTARADQSKIAAYFSDTTSVVLAPHGIFPDGSCIGGRQNNSVLLAMGKVFGFKNTLSGKRGLLYIRTDQGPLWPSPVYNFNTKVDLIREN